MKIPTKDDVDNYDDDILSDRTETIVETDSEGSETEGYDVVETDQYLKY